MNFLVCIVCEELRVYPYSSGTLNTTLLTYLRTSKKPELLTSSQLMSIKTTKIKKAPIVVQLAVNERVSRND